MSTALDSITGTLERAADATRAHAVDAIIDDLLDEHARARHDFAMFVAVKTLALERCRTRGYRVRHAEIVRAIWARIEARRWHVEE